MIIYVLISSELQTNRRRISSLRGALCCPLLVSNMRWPWEHPCSSLSLGENKQKLTASSVVIVHWFAWISSELDMKNPDEMSWIVRFTVTSDPRWTTIASRDLKSTEAVALWWSNILQCVFLFIRRFRKKKKRIISDGLSDRCPHRGFNYKIWQYNCSVAGLCQFFILFDVISDLWYSSMEQWENRTFNTKEKPHSIQTSAF